MIKTKWDRIFIGLFLAILVAWPLASLVMADQQISLTENRKLQQFPGWTALIDLTSSDLMENYLVDQLPYKQNFVYLNNAIGYITGKRLIQNLIVTDSGYLLTTPYRVSKNLLQEAASNTRLLAAECGRLNKRFLLALVPAKTAVLQQYIPPVMQTDIQQDVDTFLQAFNYDNAFQDRIVDLFPAWTAKHTVEELEKDYFQTDLHWTAAGAKQAFADLLPTFSQLYHFSQLTDPEGLTLREVSGTYLGDLNRQMVYLFASNDRAQYYEMPNKELLQCKVLQDGQMVPVELDQLYASGIEQDRIDYNSLFTENYGYFRIYNPASLNKTKLLVIKDSYQNAMLPFFVRYFELVEVVDQRYLKGKTCVELVQESNADGVLLLYNNLNIYGSMYDFN